MPSLIRALFVITTLLAVLVGPAAGGNAKVENAKADNEWVFPREDKRFSATFGDISTSLVFGDIDGDGKTNVVFGTSKGYIFAVKLGENHYRHIRVGQSVRVTPLLIDFDKKGHPDILAFGRDADLDEPAKKSRLFVIDGETFAKKADIVLDGSIVSPPALADFNGDGKVDVLVAARGLVLVDGAFEKSGGLHLFPTNGVSYASPVVEDFNDDGIYDFMYVHTEKNVPYLDVYLSTGENFEYEKLTFHLKHEVHVTPTLVKRKEGETIVWIVIAPTTDKRIDFYNLSWNEKKSEMSLQLEKEYGTNDYKFATQLPVLWTKGKEPVLYLSQPGKQAAPQTNTVNAVINTTLNAFTGESISIVYTDKATTNTPIYMNNTNKNTNKTHDGGLQPFVLLYGNDALYEFQAGVKDKKPGDIGTGDGKTEAGRTIDGRTKLTPLRPSMPTLKEIYLVRLSRASKGYSLVGLTEENGLYIDSTISINLPLAYPNVPTYFNQGVYPPQEMLSLLREMESTIDWRNEGGIRRLASLAAQLYPADNDFREALGKYRMSVLKEKRLYAGIETLKAEMRKKAKKYDYLTIVQWVMSENVEKKLDYIVKNDPEFLEEDGIAGLYTKIRIAREFVEAFFPLANWIVILSLFVLIVFNYPFFIKAYYEIFLRGRIKRSCREILMSEPTARQLVDEIGVYELIKRRHSHLSDLKLRFLLPMVIKRGDNLWHDCLRLIEDEAVQKGHHRDRAFFRYLLYLYKKLFYIKIRRESLSRWLVFQLLHFFRRDFYDFPSSDPALNTIKYELALKFLSLNEYKPAFNYINKQILTCPDNPQLREFLNLIQEHKIENYFYTLGSHFFKRNRGIESQIKILSYFKGLNLSHRVDHILNDMLRESLRRNGFPKVVVSDYVPLQCMQVHPLYLSISAYNYIRKAKVVLRCIPVRYRSLNLTSDPRINTLPEQFARLYNTHRNRRWIVQVEADLSKPALECAKLPPKDVQKVLLSIIGIVKKVSPLWFVPNLHPSFVHYDGTGVCLSGTGLSKLELDRLAIRMHGVFKKKAIGYLFTTPELYDNPHTEAVLSDQERMNKTVSYLLGLLAYWMIEGHLPESEEPRQFGQFGPPGQLGKFREAERFVYAAMAPYEVRATLETLEHIALSMPVEWKT